jgi:DNA-binding NarL/FixJ family response regulator
MWLISQGAISGKPPFLLKPGSYLVGRSAKCDIPLHDSSISRRHARIVVQLDGIVEITDLASRNGLYLNDKLVESAILAVGDRIRLGAILCRIASSPPHPLQRTDFDEDEEQTLPCPPKKAPEEIVEIKLSPKKQAIADLIAKGFRQEKIAKLRGISFHTAHNHVRQLYRLFGVKNLAAFLAKYHSLQNGAEKKKRER